ncbi:hypothetical protein JG688_00011770 [Phytophthora aleatoria]|uniref:Ubiquitin-like protease family profile domain-containing protein n=1 Tax=Phytophthora aleatoria TaxID=2496075 RepID=A0A8J5IG98_9STRA|nr:hypothetical protein JG688_00011770 [Phytophthora aleatoria]
MPGGRAGEIRVYIDTNHWICLIIDLDAKKIYVYDSIVARSQRRIATAAESLYADTVSSEAPTNLTPTGIERLRWKMLLAVLKTRYVAE